MTLLSVSTTRSRFQRHACAHQPRLNGDVATSQGSPVSSPHTGTVSTDPVTSEPSLEGKVPVPKSYTVPSGVRTRQYSPLSSPFAAE